MENSKTKQYILLAIIAVLAIVIIKLYFFGPEPIDSKEKEYLEVTERLKASDKAKAELIVKLQDARDSSFVAIKNNVVTGTIVIEKKHEKIRTNIRLLHRSDRVQLFADRYKQR